MQDKLPDTETTPAVTERRTCPRFRVTSLMYIDIGNINGGIVTSLSEKGLALTAGDTLGNAEFGDGPLRMRIQVPGIPEALEASGEIVWKSSSGKEVSARFVEIGDKAREQICKWISDRASSNGLRPKPPKPPRMRFPKSRRARPRARRFSFADVASSRIDGEGETGIEYFPGIIGEPGKLPPLEAGEVGFRDGAEAVASAFESPAFTEDRTGKTRSPAQEQTIQVSPEQDLQSQPSLSIPERRQHPRKQILLFTYAVLGEDNGGLVFNLGEGGLALTAAAALQEHHFAKMRVRFPDSVDWFETSGRLAWKSDSGREAGIEFVNLPEDARARIREWVPQGELSSDLATTEGEVRASEAQAQELPSFMDEELSATELVETSASFEEQPFESQTLEEDRFEERTKTFAASSCASLKTGIKGILERVSVKRRVAKINTPPLADHSAKPRSRLASKTLSIAAGVALAVGGWMFFQRTSLNEASRLIAQNLPNTQSSHEPLQGREIAKTEVGTSGASTDPSLQPIDSAPKQNGISTPSLQQIEKAPTHNTSKIAVITPNSSLGRASKEKPHTKDPLEHITIESSAPRSSNQALRTEAPSQRERETKSPQLPASAQAPSSENKLVENKVVESKPAEDKPVQINQAFAAQDKDLNVTSPLPNSNPSQPAATPAVDLEKEKPSPPAPKQPEPVLARTPVVTVSFDPFPSIRMPKTEKSKKSPQGKSLQMGRLLSRVDPVYPEEAKQQGIEGTVKLYAIFNRDGAAQSVTSVSGPPLLVPAAINAIRQWRYSQTLLGGQAMETEEDVTVLFRLEKFPR